MTEFEWLNSYQKIEQKIALIDWELEKYKSELRRWKNPRDLGRYSLVKDSKASKLEILIADKEYDLAIEMNHKYDLKKVIYSFRGLEQHILRMKYVEGLTLKEIASELGYAYEYIRRKHAHVVKKIPHKKKIVQN